MNKLSTISIVRSLIYIILVTAIVQHFPLIKQYYSLLHIVITIISISCLCLLIASVNGLIIGEITTYLIFLLFYSLWLIMIGALAGHIEDSFSEIVYACVFIVIGSNISFEDLSSANIAILYSLANALMLISVIYFYGVGFVILPTYMIDEKNQIGAQAGYGLLIAFYGFEMNQRKSKRFLLLLIIIVSFASLLVLRARAVLLSLILIALIYIVKKIIKVKNIKQVIIGLIMLVVIYILFSNFLFDKIRNSFLLGFNNSGISITSYRFESYINAFKYIMEKPILGLLSGKMLNGIKPHNYLIYKLLQYGLLFSIPYLIFIIYLFIQVLKELSLNTDNCYFWKWLIIAYGLIISMFEYAFPFLPGTTHIIFWITLGIIDKKSINARRLILRRSK